jgi:hypothetical protein
MIGASPPSPKRDPERLRRGGSCCVFIALLHSLAGVGAGDQAVAGRAMPVGTASLSDPWNWEGVSVV